MKTVVMSRQQAEWAGMSVSVAGGWIAVGCDRVPESYQPNRNNTAGVTIPGGILALVPDDWTACIREISREDAREHLSRSVNGTDDAREFLATIS